MKEQRNIQELVAEVRRQTAAKQDYLAPTADMRYVLQSVDVEDAIAHEIDDAVARARRGRKVDMTEGVDGTGVTPALHWATGTNGSRREHEMTLNTTAHTQLANHLGIPTRYYNKLMDNYPELLAENVNTLLADQPEKEVRTLRTLDGRIRAFLSSSYRPLDNLTFLNAMLPVLAPDNLGTQVDWRSAGISDDHMHIKFTVPVLQEEVRVGTVVRMGGYYGNSETGLGYRVFYPFSEVLSCTNGAYYTRWDAGARQRHLGGRKDSMVRITDITEQYKREQDDLRKLATIVTRTLSPGGLKLLTTPMAEAMKVEVGSPAGAVEVLGRRFGLTQNEQMGVLDYFMQERRGGPTSGRDQSIWALSQGITRYSQDVDDYDRATELERIGGEVITLSPRDWRVIADAKPQPVMAR